ncbi:MAG: iron ABC transporter permease [Coriobacteriales bacterium]|nr:iron ABC transporter permease [Coriobacteriales bacterium]
MADTDEDVRMVTAEGAEVASKPKHSGFWNTSVGLVLIILPIVLFLFSLAIGAYHVTPSQVIRVLLGHITGNMPSDVSSLSASIIWDVRLPRVISAALVGAGLSVAGAVFQGIFKNPLASPYTLGVSNGAGFGAALAIVLSLGAAFVQLFAVAFGLLAVALTFLIASRGRRNTVTLVLAGMLIGALFSSLVSLLKFTADPTEKLPQIVYWLMGSLSGVGFDSLLKIVPFYVLCLIVVFLYRWRTNVLALGDQEARSFGINVRRDRAVVVGASSMLTALSVSLAGIIGWVGIVVPHLARMLVGPDFRRLIPASVSLGICYLLVIDDICRTLAAVEIPIGVITGIIGVPMFLYFIYKKKVNW